MNLKECFNLSQHEVISLIGSGGKTSLMFALSQLFDNDKVLITTTTKIGFPTRDKFDHYISDEVPFKEAARGITLLASNGKVGEKITDVSLEALKNLVPSFDKVLIEADGSKTLPLKGWKPFEPVIIEETTLTIGLIPISVLEEEISEEIIHRLPLFLNMIEKKKGDKIDAKTLAEVIAHPNGLFAKAKGKRQLVINQVETKEDLYQASLVILNLPKKFLETLDSAVAISVHRSEGFKLWQK